MDLIPSIFSLGFPPSLSALSVPLFSNLKVVELMQASSCTDVLQHEQILAMVSSMQAEAILQQGDPNGSLEKVRIVYLN